MQTSHKTNYFINHPYLSPIVDPIRNAFILGTTRLSNSIDRFKEDYSETPKRGENRLVNAWKETHRNFVEPPSASPDPYTYRTGIDNFITCIAFMGTAIGACALLSVAPAVTMAYAAGSAVLGLATGTFVVRGLEAPIRTVCNLLWNGPADIKRGFKKIAQHQKNPEVYPQYIAALTEDKLSRKNGNIMREDFNTKSKRKKMIATYNTRPQRRLEIY